jgi:hypothetical protein
MHGSLSRSDPPRLSIGCTTNFPAPVVHVLLKVSLDFIHRNLSFISRRQWRENQTNPPRASRSQRRGNSRATKISQQTSVVPHNKATTEQITHLFPFQGFCHTPRMDLPKI